MRFRKPFIARTHPGPERPARYPYPKKLLRRYDIFPLFVLDGGAFFFTSEHIAGATGAHFLQAFHDGSLLAPWRRGKRILWNKAYEDTAQSACRTTLEQQVWLNRLYFLLPIAHAFFRTRDEKYARAWYRLLDDWLRANPADGPDAGRLAASHRNWFDMQVTWRLIVLIHSAHLLAKTRSFGPKRWTRIHQAIHAHALHVHQEAAAALADNSGRGNHFLQKAVALTYAAALYPQFPQAPQFLHTARAVVLHQMKSEIWPDGGSIETSPSYSHFIARLYLDVALLLKNNALPPIDGLEASIRRQYAWLQAAATPQGLTLQVSDSYALDARQDLEIVRQLFPLAPPKPQKSIALPDSRLAILRNPRIQAFIDAMPVAVSHNHPGKPNLLLFVDGQPLLVDSGCANYDSDWWINWLRQPAAHNILTIEPQASPKAAPRDPKNEKRETAILHFDDNRLIVAETLQTPAWRCVWTRTVTLEPNALLLADRIEATIPVQAEQHLHIAPRNILLAPDRRKATVQMPDGDIAIERTRPARAAEFHLAYRPAVNARNRIAPSAHLTSHAAGKRILLETRFVMPS